MVTGLGGTRGARWGWGRGDVSGSGRGPPLSRVVSVSRLLQGQSLRVRLAGRAADVVMRGTGAGKAGDLGLLHCGMRLTAGDKHGVAMP